MRFHRVEEALIGPQPWLDATGQEAQLRLLRSSHKFYFGQRGLLPGDYVAWKDFPKMPYPEMACEVEVDFEDGRHGSVIGLLKELPAGVAASIFMVMRDRVLCFGMYMINTESGESRWFPHLGEMGAAPDIKQRLCAGAEIGLAALGLGMRVLHSRSIKTEMIAAPGALNRKRAAKGRGPVYEYAVLVLRETDERITGISGSHEAPILHTVRGHWKERESGWFWWNWHVRGDRAKGVRRKDYDASNLPPEPQA